MAPKGPSPPGGGDGGYSEQPPTLHQTDIDRGTDLFRKQLEVYFGKKQDTQPSVKGGLPPHLLRQRNKIGPAAHDHDHRRNIATPSQVSTSLNNTRLKQFHPHSTVTPSSVHPALNTQTIASKHGSVGRRPPIATSTPTQRRRSIDTRNQGKPDIGLPASRWAGGPQQAQRHIHKEQSTSHKEQRALVFAGGVRLSVNTSRGWSPANRPDSEQHRQMDTNEPARMGARKWRPKHSCDLESQDLPDSAAYSLDFCNSNNSRGEDAALGSPDVRNTVGGELDLVPKVHGKGFYNKDRWDEYPEVTKSLDWRPSYCKLWVQTMENEEWPVAVFLKVKEMPHEQCDVQTRNGWLMPPIDYPETHIDPEDTRRAQYEGYLSRRLMSSSSEMMQAEYAKLKRRVDKREGEVKWEPTDDSFPVVPFTAQLPKRAGQITPPSTQSYVNRSPVMEAEPPIYRQERTILHPVYGAITHLPRTLEPNPPPTYLKIACFLRPAEENEISQLLDIYNGEVSHGMQALDTKRLCLKDMARVFQKCRDAKTPMIVAIAGTPAEAKARREHTLARRGRYSVPQQQSQQPEQDKVIGFAYVSILAPGLAGDVHYNVGRFQGQVHIYVTHECRRKGIGRALLHRITIFCSRHASYYANEYKWHNPEGTSPYDEAAFNSRSYSHIFIEFVSRAEDDPDTLWMSRLLDTENFFCVSTQDKARKVGYGEDAKLVDCLVWQHECQDLQQIKENNRNIR